MNILSQIVVVFVVISLYLSAAMSNSPNISYGESECESKEEYKTDACKKIPIRLHMSALNIPTNGAMANPIWMMSGFLNEFGIDVVKAVITLFVVIDPIGIVPLFASYTERMQTKDRKSVSKQRTISR
jgi:uncharacterized membrane protein